MRNFIIKPELTANDQYLNALTLQAHVDDDYYTVDFYPSSFMLSGNAAAPSTSASIVSLPTSNEVVSVVKFRNGQTDEIKGSLRSRLYWEKGALEFSVYFTGSTGNTNNLQWSLRAFSHALSEDITAAAVISPNELVAGPSTALTLKKYVFTEYLPFSREKELINFRLFRTSTAVGDTYTGDAYLTMLRVRLIPSMNQTGTKF